ncbi:MAG: S8 family serine peptidase [Saprospirales bacterium]|nr:S8 family serine peptidase [Saprospirales bacterium]
MAKLTIKSGKGELRLRKSSSLVGLKAKNPEQVEGTDFVSEKVFENMGGFQVVSLQKGEMGVDEQLDEVRKKDEILLGSHVYYAEGSKNPIIATGEILIEFQEETDESEQQLVLDEFYLEMVERRTDYQIIAKVTAKSPNPFKVAQFLQKISLVKLAEPDLDTPLDHYDFRPPNDTLLAHQWHLRNTGRIVDTNYPTKWGADAKVIDAWARMGNMGSSEVVVAIVDNGFDLSHPDLAGKIYKPYDFWTRSSQLYTNDPRFAHGTPCASLALASSNGTGIVGVAPNAKFMPVSGTSFSWRATEEIFDYCTQNGADIISCSWGTIDQANSLNSLKEQAITKAAKQGRNGKGCIILFAVGNDDKDYVSYYAAHPDVIAVGACTSKDEFARYSNRGRQVSICAPSNGDWPLIAARSWWDQGDTRFQGNQRFWADGRSRGDKYMHFGGTSGATPIVAGICALMLSVNPDLTAKEVKQILKDTADKIGSPGEYINGHSSRYGYGRVNADRAVAEAIRRRTQGTTPSPVVSAEPSSPPPSGFFKVEASEEKPKGWGVQIGAFSDYNNVLALSERIKRLFGVSILISPVASAGKTIYKVVAGSFPRSSEAISLQDKMHQSGINGFVRNLEDIA